MSLKSKKNEFKFEVIFKITYFVLVLLSFNTYFARRTYLSYISYAVAIFGALIIINRLTHIKDYINKYTIVLICFVFSYMLSSIINRKYGIIENIQAITWMTIQYFILFSMDISRDNKMAKKEIDIISYVFIGYTAICSIIGFVMLVLNYSYYKVVNGEPIIGGFLWNRLWGIYTDPNYGAVFAVVSIFLSLYYIRRNVKKPFKTFLIINLIFEFLYISYSDSRTGMVSFLCSIVLFVFMKLFRDEKIQIKDKQFNFKGLKKIFVCSICSLLIAMVFVGAKELTLKVTGEIKLLNITNTQEYKRSSKEEKEALNKMHKIGRSEEDINNGDYSNKRFSIWSSAFEVFKTSPLTGTSFRNITEYSKDVVPNTYIAQEETAFQSMHNFIIDIMISQGTIGLLIIFIFIVILIKDLLTKIKFIRDEEYVLFTYLFTCIIAIMVSGMFYSEIFYMNTGGSFIFWSFLGYLTNNLINLKDKE